MHELLPITTVQPSFTSVLTDVEQGTIPYEDIWVSRYDPDPKRESYLSEHGKLRVSLDDHDRNLVKLTRREGSVKIERAPAQDHKHPPRYVLSSRNETSKLYFPAQSYADAFYANQASPHRITAFDIAPNEEKFAMGFLDGSIALCSASNVPPPRDRLSEGEPTIKVDLKERPHKSTVTSLRFFPSSKVLLSTSADFSLHILSANTASEADGIPLQPARTFQAHTRAVTDACIVGVGRTVISASADTTVRVWDVPSRQNTSTVWFNDGGVTSLALPSEDSDTNTAYAATLGGVYRLDLRARAEGEEGDGKEKIIESGASSLALSANLLATGSAKGVVRIFDVRAPGTPLHEWRRGWGTTVSVDSLCFLNASKLVVCTSDGMPYVASLKDGGIKVDAEIVGPDCYPARHARLSSGGALWTAADDGIVRRYDQW
ncbi:WD40 repeat-like protein [Cylindrobasidium torrendii FP15055 ss-10]|uniref:WD40 repeat-like protein n=1 Tax=Cylindrobasidium torrendii FP15055 ss-10 TaxID=1314674 RepID=A0A0D7BSK4_9AGAR|nr:WD40 repeat-like protein [Cylindrobasidium torrendii FP15055 ss-10]